MTDGQVDSSDTSEAARRLHVLMSLTAADALGAATEFKTPAAIEARYGLIDSYRDGSPFGFAPGEATDDSQMTVATLLGYGRGEGEQGVLTALLDWVKAGPPDVGGLTGGALSHRSLDGGYRAWVRGGRNGAGNGGLMRVAAAFIAGFTGERLMREAARLTALTHTDPRCVFASVFLVVLLEGLDKEVPWEAAVEGAVKRTREFDAAAALVGTLLPPEEAHDYSARQQDARQEVLSSVEDGLAHEPYSQSGYVLHTLQAAISHARSHDWLSSVQGAVMLGDDSDTVACIVGAIQGAKGLAVPEHLLPPLRLGHSWPGWERGWSCQQHYPAVVQQALQFDHGRPGADA